MTDRSKTRSAARLAAVQALYQMEMEATPLAQLLHEFHQHRLGATIEDVTYHPAELLRKEELKRKAWEDLQWLQRRMAQENGQARP